MNPNSILAILAEIKANPLGYLLDADEKREALAIIERMERRLKHGKQAEASRSESPVKAG